MVYIMPQIEAFHIHACTHTLYCGAVHTNRTSGDNIRKGRYATPFVAIIQSNYAVHTIWRSGSLQDEKKRLKTSLLKVIHSGTSHAFTMLRGMKYL